MILTIVNILCLVIVIGVMLYIVLQYLSIKSDLTKAQAIIPNVASVRNTLVDVKVPAGPAPSPSPTITATAPALAPSPSPTTTASPAPSPSPTTTTASPAPAPAPYTPPAQVGTYYTILQQALSSFKTNKDMIIAQMNSETLLITKDAKAYFAANPYMVPFITWFVYETGPDRQALDQKLVQEMYTALSYMKDPAYTYTTTSGSTHMSVLTMALAPRTFYINNKTYIDQCIKANNC